MNVRERKLAFSLVGILLLAAAGFLFYQLYWSPISEESDNIARLSEQVENRKVEILEIDKKNAQLSKWRKLSLPRDVNFSSIEYHELLTRLKTNAGFSEDTLVNPRPPDTRGPALKNKQPIYTRLEYTISGRAALGSLVSFLKSFHQTPLLHRVKSLRILRPPTGGPDQEKDELRIDMTVEALILDGAENRKTLLPAANVQKEVLAKAGRNYDTIAAKNIFLGPEPTSIEPEALDVTQFVRLTSISTRDGRWEAFLFDVASNPPRNMRVRDTAGFNTFKVFDDNGDILVSGKLERLDNPREMIISENGKYFRVHVGETLAEALGRGHRKYLSEDDVKKLGLGAPPKKELSKQ